MILVISAALHVTLEGRSRDRISAATCILDYAMHTRTMHVPSPWGHFPIILYIMIYLDQHKQFNIENGSSGLFLIDAFHVEQDPS